MAALTNAQIVAKMKRDNRTVLATPDQTTAGKVIVATDLGPEGVKHGLATASTADAAAYKAGVDEGAGSIEVLAGGGADQSVLSKDYLRTQFFLSKGSYDSTKAGFGAKRCFVNLKGQPLDASGEPTTVDDAVDAEDTDLTARGEAVTNYAQVYKGADRTPVPGVYGAPNSRQTALYQPYYGWTAQH